MGIDWEGILSKLKLIDVKMELTPQGDQIGVINLQNETNKTTQNINVNLPNPEAARAFGEGIGKGFRKTELEARAKEDAKRKLEPIEPIMGFLPESTQTEIASGAIGLSAVEAITGSVRLTMPLLKVQLTGRTNPVNCKGCGIFVNIEDNYCHKCGAKLR